MKIGNSFFERAEKFKYLGTTLTNNPNESKFYSGRNYEQIDVRECLLLFRAESFVLVCYP
jgi:hypothetical protein